MEFMDRARAVKGGNIDCVLLQCGRETFVSEFCAQFSSLSSRASDDYFLHGREGKKATKRKKFSLFFVRELNSEGGVVFYSLMTFGELKQWR